ncbi:MAG: hybrid sensor histidine kinase/response regulator [Limisphaerales bacterium]
MGRILIVDDEPAVRDCMATALRRQGHETLLAGSAAEGLTLASQQLPDLIISDVCMEGGDGFEFLRTIRSDQRTGAIPFIIVTGHPDQEGMLQGMEQAADGYLPKPLSLASLIAAVQNRLKREELVRRDASEIKTQLFRVLQAAPDLIAIVDPETLAIHFLNSVGKRMLDWTEDSHQALTAFFPPAAAENLVSRIIPTALKSGHWMGESVLVAPSGRRMPVEIVLQSHRRNDEKVEYFSVIARDLSERKENESALRASEYRFRCLVDALPDGVMIYDAEGQISFCNARAVELLGYTPHELLGHSAAKIFGGTLPAKSKTQGESRSAHSGHFEAAVTRKSGETLAVSLFRERLEIQGGEVELCIFHDLTERKRMERERQEFEVQLRQAQKLESIGQLAAGIAHEINTPTQYIGDNTRFLKDAFAGVVKMLGIYQEMAKVAAAGPVPTKLLQEAEAAASELDVPFLLQEIPAALDQSLDGIQRVSKIVRAMKDFSHPNSAEKSALDINNAIESTLMVARNEWKYVAEVETKFDATLSAVPCLPGEFNQVILNLIVNAAHAIADVVVGTDKKGTIRVTTSRVAGWAEIRISDTGTGIPKEAQARIFEPFFTTKEVGKGTGQGLAIARSVIVDKHSGTIVFETEKGRGTTFIIRLPLTAQV